MPRAADLVFRGGPVFRSDAARSLARAVAVTEGRITAVGGDDAVRDLIGPATQVVDLDGRMVCPGFQDAHVHPHTGGSMLRGCDLSGAATLDEARGVIAAYAAAHPDVEWIWGGGWRFAWFPGGMPSRELLDGLVPDRPAYLRVADGHAGWANSRALALAGIDARTPDPPGGRIERHADGIPQGTLQESAMDLVERLRPDDPDEMARSLLRGQEYLLALGITAWQDASVEPALHDTYVRLAGDGSLRATVRGALWWDPHGDVTEQLTGLEERRRQSVGRYTAGSVKLMLDGVVENFTARMLRPYLDGAGVPTSNAGMDFFDPATLPMIVTEIVRHGFQPHFHALGDAAVRAALDAVAVAREAVGWTDVRPLIAHLQVVDRADLPRFRELGVIADIQPLWACHEAAMLELTLPFLPPEAARQQYPFRDLLDAGATVAMGSDWSVSTANVMFQVEVAVHRTVPGDPTVPPFLPEQRIGVGEALAAFTSGSAYANHLDRDRGVIVPGAVADLVVLGGDPFAADDIGSIPVDLTVIDGEVVFSR